MSAYKSMPMAIPSQIGASPRQPTEILAHLSALGISPRAVHRFYRGIVLIDVVRLTTKKASN